MGGGVSKRPIEEERKPVGRGSGGVVLTKEEKSDSDKEEEEQVGVLDEVKVPVMGTRDSICIAKQRQSTEPSNPPSKFLKTSDSILVTKERHSLGIDNSDDHAHKIASLNANLKKKHRSAPSFIPQFKTRTPIKRQTSRRGSLKTSSESNQIGAHVSMMKLVDPEAAAIIEAKEMASTLYAHRPLSPEDDGTKSTRRGSLSTSFEAKQDDAYIKLLREANPQAAEKEVQELNKSMAYLKLEQDKRPLRSCSGNHSGSIELPTNKLPE
jgi:hypothetical protein